MSMSIEGLTSTSWVDFGLTQIVNSAAPVSGSPSPYLGALVYAPYGTGNFLLYIPGQAPQVIGTTYAEAKLACYQIVRAAGKYPIP